MKRLAILVAACLTAASLFARPITFKDMEAMRRIGAPQVSPDGKWIAYDGTTVDLAGNTTRSAIYLVPSTGGASKQISDGTKRDEGPAWSPDGKTIAYVSNRATDASQVYLYDLAAGTSRKLTDLTGGAGSIKWMPDGSGLLVVSDVYPDCGVDAQCTKEKTAAEAARQTSARVMTGLLYRHWKSWRGPTRSHILYVPMTGAARDLTPGNFDAPPFSIGGGDEFDVSPDGRELVYASNTDPHPELSTNSDVFIVPMMGGAPKRITTRAGSDTAPKYSPDGKWIAWRSQARAGYESDLWELWLYDRATGATMRLAPQFDNWIESFVWSPDSASIYFTAPETGHDAIYEIGVRSGAPRKLYASGSSSSLAVSRDGRTIYFNLSSLTRPAEIYALTKITGGSRALPVTHDNDALVAQLTMNATDYWWKGADGTPVQGFIVKPPDFDATKKYPAIVFIHGGPQGAWNDAWGYRWNPQILAARGYVMFMPNPRGSSGYGQKFLEEISGDWGGKAYTDIMNGVDALAAMPFVDGSRIGAAGGSYGGYMVDWILGHSDRFKALVSHAGVYDLESMYGVTEELWFPEWEFKGNPWDNPELYAKWSPNKFVKNFKTPTLVTGGELDFRVPVNQEMELFTALQRRGVPSKLILFPDEGHFVLKPQNSKFWYQSVGDWFDQWVKK